MDQGNVDDHSPYRAGDWVTYAPSLRGEGLEANYSGPAHLLVGKRYRVASVEEGRYLILEAHSHPLGGLHWSEFAPG